MDTVCHITDRRIRYPVIDIRDCIANRSPVDQRSTSLNCEADDIRNSCFSHGPGHPGRLGQRRDQGRIEKVNACLAKLIQFPSVEHSGLVFSQSASACIRVSPAANHTSRIHLCPAFSFYSLKEADIIPNHALIRSAPYTLLIDSACGRHCQKRKLASIRYGAIFQPEFFQRIPSFQAVHMLRQSKAFIRHQAILPLQPFTQSALHQKGLMVIKRSFKVHTISSRIS